LARHTQAAGAKPRRANRQYTPAAPSNPYIAATRWLGTAAAPPHTSTQGSTNTAGTGGKLT